jgi:hypothetical protein
VAAGRLPDLVARLRLDTSDLARAEGQVRSFGARTQSSLGGADGAMGRFANSTKRVGDNLSSFGQRASLFATLPIVAGFGAATKAASDLSEETNKTRVVFGDAAQSVIDFSEDSAKALGQSQRAALQSAGTYGNLFRAIGLTEQRSAEMSQRLLTLGADLASFNNANPEDVFLALRAGLVGETEPLRKFGVNLNDARLKAEALNLGLADGKGVLDANAKAQAAYSLILKDTTLAQGDFARTADGMANKTRTLKAELEDTSAKIGQQLIPVALQLTNVASGVLGVLDGIPDSARSMLVIGTLAAAAVGPIAFLAGNVLKVRAALDAATAAAARHSLAAGASTAATIKMAGALGKIGLAGAGLTLVAEGLKAIGVEAANTTANMEELAAASGAELVKAFEEANKTPKGKGLGGFIRSMTDGLSGVGDEIEKTSRRAEFFRSVLERSPTEAQRLVDALREAGHETGEFQQQIDKTIAARGASAVASEKDRAAIDRAADAARGGGDALDGNTGALDTNTSATDANADAHLDGAKAAEEHAKRLADTLDATESAVDAEFSLASAGDAFARSVRDVADKERDLAEARRRRTDSTRDALDVERALNGVEDAQSSILDAERDLARAREGRGDRARALIDAERDLAGAQADFASARGVKDQARAGERVADAEERLRRAREDGGQAEDVRRATEDLSRARLNSREAALSLADAREQAAGRESEAAERVADAERDLADAKRTAAEQAVNLASSTRDLLALQIEMSGRVPTAEEKYRLFRDELVRLKDTVAAGSELHTALTNIINTLAPPKVIDESVARIEKLRKEYEKLKNVADVQGPTLFGPVGAPVVRHQGGPIGGSRREVPAILERGEFVVRKEAVAKLGLDALWRLNRYHQGGPVRERRFAEYRLPERLPRFHDGGLVGTMAGRIPDVRPGGGNGDVVAELRALRKEMGFVGGSTSTTVNHRTSVIASAAADDVARAIEARQAREAMRAK